MPRPPWIRATGTDAVIKHWLDRGAVRQCFTADRGFAVVLGSAAPFASQLMVELLDDIEKLSSKDVHVHYLPMPRMFVSRGGMGTHWMVPKSINVVDPSREDPDSGEIRSIKKKDLIDLVFMSHGPESCDGKKPHSNAPKHLKEYLEWMCNDPHEEVWAEFLGSVD